MNKSLAMVMALSTTGMQAMETDEAKSWSIMVRNTEIKVIQGFIGDAGDRVGAIVVGRNQQRTLQEPSLGDLQHVGRIEFRGDHIIYSKGKEDESASDDDTYKPYEHADYWNKDEKTKIWKRLIKTKVNADVLQIIEPRIVKTNVWDSKLHGSAEASFYYAQRQNPEKENLFFTCQETGQQAIDEASKDLRSVTTKFLMN